MDIEDKVEALEIFPWNQNFETGIKQIDDEHKVLVVLLNKLANALTQETTYEIEETFNELATYANFHFKSEEAVWKKYLGTTEFYTSHKATHDSFLPEVVKLQEKNSDKTFHEGVEDILLFLIRWLAFHIIDEDKRLAYIIKAIEKGKPMKEAIFETDTAMGGSMKSLIEAILTMYDNLSLKAISLIRERKARIKAQKELKKINQKLERLSITDQLTGLNNRRHFEDVFERELKRSKREKRYLGVILFDIDHFKKLNDTYGHHKGDDALQSVAKTMQSICRRPTDFCFRVGGEEFCIIVANEKIDSIMHLANLLKESITNLNIENKNSMVQPYLTISAGVVSVIPEQEDTMDSLMRIADERLYQAKESGRNQII